LFGFLGGISQALLMGAVKLVMDLVFPTPGVPTIFDKMQ
jgi:hypothetical protein